MIKSGDVVMVYAAETELGIFKARVRGPYGDRNGMLIDVDMPNGKIGSFYRKQCRKLKRKSK